MKSLKSREILGSKTIEYMWHCISSRLMEESMYRKDVFENPYINGRLNEFDIANMKAIGQRVNLIPVIAKADSLTDDELYLNKTIIRKSLRDNGIQVYDFVGQDIDHYSDDEESSYLQLLQETYPFSIISCGATNEDGGRYRVTPWGTINIQDHDICNFTLLKNVLLGSHIEEFKVQTIRNHYEAYRLEQLLEKPEEIV